MKTEQAIKIADEIIGLYKLYGGSDYAGEEVTQLQHMLQAGWLARETGSSNKVILAAFLHDIGHICIQGPQVQTMNEFGIKDHEEIGSDFLLEKGFSNEIRELVASHVEAKRYLTFKFPEYYDALSLASRETLNFQGGPMSEIEAAEFESREHFQQIINLRKWDDQAKNTESYPEDLDYYHNLIVEHLINQ